jgi:hypothetical protein
MKLRSFWVAAFLLTAACAGKHSDPRVVGTYSFTTPLVAGAKLLYTLELKVDGTASLRRQKQADDLSPAEFGFWEARGGNLSLTIMGLDLHAVGTAGSKSVGREKVAATLAYQIEQEGDLLRSMDGKGPDFRKN